MRGFKIRDAVSSDRGAIASFDHVVQLEPERATFIERALRSATCEAVHFYERVEQAHAATPGPPRVRPQWRS